MNINQSVYNTHNFGRAFTTKEKVAYSSLINDAKQELKLQDTSAIIFDFNVPSKKGKNTGIGTTFSESMQNFSNFLKTMVGITSIQLQPQGKISAGNTSPYSGSNYAYGEHIIDLLQLTTPQYASLLTVEDLEKADESYKKDKQAREYKTDYEYVIGDGEKLGIQQTLLKQAFSNFKKKISKNDPTAKILNNELNLFIKSNQSWIEKNSLFEALSKHYSTTDFSKWEDIDKNLFASSCSKSTREKRIQEIKLKYADDIELENFKQFIADKQQRNSRKFLNTENIKIYGDCLIGFSKAEMWSNIDCFRENLFYGGPDPNCPETNGIQTWGLPALDYTKLGECSKVGDLSKIKEVGKFLYDKYITFFKRYDGIRMDAAWQFITPFIYTAENGNYEQLQLPEINFTIFNIMKTAAKNVLGDKFDEKTPENIMLELVGLSAGKSRELTLNKYPHLYTTAFAEYDETPKKFLEKGYKDGKFYVGVSCHDNDSLVNMAKDEDRRNLHIKGMKRDYNIDMSKMGFDAKEYQTQSKEGQIQEDYRTAKFSEIFTTSKQFFTLPDAFGMSERINISGKVSKNNWTVRIPTDYERFYFSQLSKGFGLNLPKTLANAMEMKKSKNSYLIQKCKEAAEILRSSGPLTEEDANVAQKEGKIQKTFEYIS